MEVKKYRSYWAVYDENEKLVCVTVYKKGAMEVKRRMDILLNRLNEGKQNESVLQG